MQTNKVCKWDISVHARTHCVSEEWVFSSLAQFPWHRALGRPIRTRPSVSAAFRVSWSDRPESQCTGRIWPQPAPTPSTPPSPSTLKLRNNETSSSNEGHGHTQSTPGMFSKSCYGMCNKECMQAATIMGKVVLSCKGSLAIHKQMFGRFAKVQRLHGAVHHLEQHDSNWRDIRQ